MEQLKDLDESMPYNLSQEVVKQGAEAKLYECIYLGKPAIMKRRFPKSYRHELLDKQLNKCRLRNEIKGIVKAKQLMVDAPSIYFIDIFTNSIIMEHIAGITAADWIEQKRIELVNDILQFETIVRTFGKILGSKIARMHTGGLIHGDLTTSNVILRKGNVADLVFLDFGLSEQGKVTAEEKGVDLYVLERALISTHVNSQYIFEEILAAYMIENEKNGKAIIQKLDEIRLRGRKRDMVG